MANINGRYQGPYYIDGDYYIHFHVSNIGRAANGEQNIDINFKQQKSQAVNAAKTYYRYLFKENLSLQSQKLLNEVIDNDNIMTELNRQMTASLQKAVNVNTIKKGMELQRSVMDNNTINKIVKNEVASFDQLLTTYAKCCILLKSPEGNKLALLLMKVVKSPSATTIAQKSAALNTALNNFIANNNTKTFSGQQVEEVAKRMNSLAKNLNAVYANDKKNLTKESLTTLADAVFNTGFGESFGGMVKNVCEMNVTNSIRQMTGTDKTKIQVTDEKGQITGFQGRSDAGKVDIKLSNVQMSFSTIQNLSGGSITIDIGISNKQYRTQHFPGLDDKLNAQTFGGGSGGTLKEALDAIFGTGSSRNKYLSYNILAHSNKPSIANEVQQLNDLIATRQILRIFSTRGGAKDFAQFMLVNGQIISIWDLILAAENSFLGLSASNKASSNQAIVLSIPGRPEIYKATKNRYMHTRIPRVNDLINKSKITAHIHVNKLASALAKK